VSHPPKKRSPRVIDPGFLLHAYSQGYFPMAMDNGEIGWFSPDPRAIIPLEQEEFHIPRTLRVTLRKNPFEIRLNTAFAKVMEGCAKREETWIDKTIQESYLLLHRLGHAHSVECWQNNQLVGGLYGVGLGGVFFGESMFHRVTDASKVALVHLVERMRERGFLLLDTQWTTPHLMKFGAKEIPREEYLARLQTALRVKPGFC
jgi:leucyl/phenylalanyl-tRNA---protein transferase